MALPNPRTAPPPEILTGTMTARTGPPGTTATTRARRRDAGRSAARQNFPEPARPAQKETECCPRKDPRAWSTWNWASQNRLGSPARRGRVVCLECVPHTQIQFISQSNAAPKMHRLKKIPLFCARVRVCVWPSGGKTHPYLERNILFVWDHLWYFCKQDLFLNYTLMTLMEGGGGRWPIGVG